MTMCLGAEPQPHPRAAQTWLVCDQKNFESALSHLPETLFFGLQQLTMATPSGATPASGGLTPMSAPTPSAAGPMASLLASAEKFASASISPDERYRVVCEIREIASDLAISHEYPNFLSRFVPLFDDYLHKDVSFSGTFPRLPSCNSQSFRLSLVPLKISTRKRAYASWTFYTSTCR
jgi:hypothetical protein